MEEQRKCSFQFQRILKEKYAFQKLSPNYLVLLKKYNCTIVFASYSIMSDTATKLSFSYKTVFKQKEKKSSISKTVSNKPTTLSIIFLLKYGRCFSYQNMPSINAKETSLRNSNSVRHLGITPNLECKART